MKCRVCGEEIEKFMTFGRMPIANGFLEPAQFDGEYFFELAPAFCENCTTLQIIEQPEPDRMFHGEYAFFTRTSKSMVEHFGNYARWVMGSYMDGDDPFVIELGSNDGAMLENFAKQNIRHLGVEPSGNVAKEAQKYGVNSIVDFFGPSLVDKILSEYGEADAIIAANVMCHIPDLHGVGESAAKLLKPKGVLIFEDPYLGDVIEKTSYDQLYDEHVYVFSAGSVSNIFGRHGLELIDVLPQVTHGGSMRYVFAKKGQRDISPEVNKQLLYEKKLGLDKMETYDKFRISCEKNRDDLVKTLKEKKSEGARVVGYAATSKSTTVLNYCGIGPELIEYISDTTPIKQGKFCPGSHVPVKAYSEFKDNYPDYAVLFAWNHEKEIMANESGYAAAGGKWIMFVPEVSIKN